MKKLIIILPLFFFLNTSFIYSQEASVAASKSCSDCNCYEYLKKRYDSKKTVEKTHLLFDADADVQITQESLASVAPLIGAGINVGLNWLQRVIKSKADKFSAVYKKSQGEELFFIDNPELMTFQRELINDGFSDIVYSIKFKIEYSEDENYFRFKPISIEYLYPKAKVRSKVKKYKKGVDMTVSIVVYGVLRDEFPKTQKLGTNDFSFENLKLSCHSFEPDEYKSPWIPMIDGPANFVVSVLEVDDKQKRLERVSKFIDDTRGDISKGVSTYIKDKD